MQDDVEQRAMNSQAALVLTVVLYETMPNPGGKMEILAYNVDWARIPRIKS
jgi:hypothetical protein